MARILIVDDHSENRELLRGVLEVRGHEIDEAADGLEAVRAIDRDRPDLVLLDLMLPEKNGLQVLREVGEKHPSLPVIVVTAIQAEEMGRAALDAGATDWIRKPVGLERVHRAVDAALRRAKDDAVDENS